MSFYDDASLVFLAGGAAGKDGTAYSLKPTDGSGDFTFTRGTNLTATRVGKDGYIEKGRENSLLQSNQFDTTWSLTTSLSVTSGQADKDGGTNAWLLKRTDGSSRFIKQTISQSGIQSFSVYIKAESTEWVYLFLGGTTSWAYFDLGSGNVGLTNSLIDSSIEAAGNGFYRCTITASASTSEVRIYPAQSNGAVGGDSDNGVYIQDAQLEQGLVATDYIETGATTATAGLLEDEPRFDYTGGGCPALLLEPSRTNLVPHSEYHSDSTYVNDKVTITDNEAVSPEGVQNAAKIVLNSGTNTSNGGHYYPFVSAAGTNYTISVFAKAGEYRYFTFTYGSASAGGGHFDLQEGMLLGTITDASYSDVTADIEDYGNGWYRLVVSLTDNSGSVGRHLSMKPSPDASVPSNNNYSSTGDGTSGAYIYGFQIEIGTYATSYIPTYGSSATMDSDTCTTTSSNLISSQLFSMFFEHTPTGGGFSGSTFAFELNIQGTSDNVSFYVNNSGIDDGLNIYLGPTNGGYIWGTGTNDGWTVNQKSKVALTYDGDNLRYFINGVLQNSQTGVSFTDADTSLIIRHAKGNKVGQALVFPTALSNNDSEILTGATSYRSFNVMRSALNYTAYE